jgi:hypothetical protein
MNPYERLMLIPTLLDAKKAVVRANRLSSRFRRGVKITHRLEGKAQLNLVWQRHAACSAPANQHANASTRSFRSICIEPVAERRTLSFSTMPEIKVLTGSNDQSFSNLRDILGVLGIHANALPFDRVGPEDNAIVELIKNGVLIASAPSLLAALRDRSQSKRLIDSLTSHLRFLMLYGIDQCTPTEMRALLGGNTHAGRSERKKAAVKLPVSGSPVTRQMSGTVFEVDEPPATLLGLDDDAVILVESNGEPALASIRRNSCEVFLLASSDMLDLSQPTVADELPRQAYPALLPWIFFAKRALQERCWYNPSPKASLIIDDPLLWPRYGFLSYETLAASMCQHGFDTTVAFIPWNWSRTSNRTRDLFRENVGRLALCVHGCDHTGREFGLTNLHLLQQKVRTATERMNLHQRATGLPWDPVMVFPQGIFSSTSLKALQREGYLAAVNTGLANSDCEDPLPTRHYLKLAFDGHGGVPVFQRYYPTDTLPFALDLFLGKQVFIGEHHTYFREGYEVAARFASLLNALTPQLSWASVGETIRHAVQRRKIGSTTELLAYTDQISFERDPFDEPTYLVTKMENDADFIRGVHVNGRPVDYQLSGNQLQLEVDAKSTTVFQVEVLRRRSGLGSPGLPKLRYAAKVATRRYLSELRDLAAARNVNLPSSLKGLVTAVRRRIPLGSRSAELTTRDRSQQPEK